MIIKGQLVSGAAFSQLSVVGTPAEEGGGGKLKLLESGAFSVIDVAMMSHPWNAPFLLVLANNR